MREATDAESLEPALVENLLREAADFTGTPIRIVVRGRSREDRERD